jgi:hypothetical protein
VANQWPHFSQTDKGAVVRSCCRHQSLCLSGWHCFKTRLFVKISNGHASLTVLYQQNLCTKLTATVCYTAIHLVTNGNKQYSELINCIHRNTWRCETRSVTLLQHQQDVMVWQSEPIWKEMGRGGGGIKP